MLYCTRNTYRLRLGRFSLSRNKLVLTSLIVVGLGLLLIFIPIAKNILANLNKANALTPTITSISPTSGPVSGGTSVTITGTGFKAKDNFTQVAGGFAHSCGITASGQAYCWGSDTYGQLGDGGTNTNQPTPVQVTLPTGVTSWLEITAGEFHACAIGQNNLAYCWGFDGSGQLGDGGTNTDKTTPVQVTLPSGVTSFSKITAGAFHTCAIGQNNLAYCWGTDGDGQLGDNAALASQTTPVQVTLPSGVTSWTKISAGLSQQLAKLVSLFRPIQAI